MAEQVKVLKIDTGQAITSVKDLKTQLKELKNTMLSTEQGTEEYNKALRQAAEIQHVLKEQMEEVNASAMDFGQIVSNCTQAVGGLVGGFQAATAVMNLFGVENEDVIKTLKTMQQMMALTQALPAIDKGVKAFKRLALAIQGSSVALQGMSKAMVATGIGAAVAALGLLVANWDKVTDAMKRWGIISEDTKQKLEEQKKKVEDLNGEIAKLQGTYADWEKKNKISKLNSEAKNSYEELETTIEGLNIKLQEYVAKREKENQEQKTGWQQRWKQYNDEGLAILNQITQLKNQQGAILANADSYKELTKKSKEHVLTIDEAQKTFTEWAQKQVKEVDIVDAITQALDEEIKRRKELAQLKELEAEESDTSTEDEYRKSVENTIQGLRNAFMTPEEQYAKEVSALDVALKTKLIKEEEYLKLRDALNKEQTQREIQRYAIAANGIGSIFSSLGELMEEGSAEQKAFQIMGATINMLGGITAAISGAFTTHSGPWDIALAAIQATAIATSGAVTIAKMAKTNESNATSMASATPSTAAIASLTAPVQYTQDIQGANIEGAIKNSKVYVTETDITDTQEKVRVSENEARF